DWVKAWETKMAHSREWGDQHSLFILAKVIKRPIGVLATNVDLNKVYERIHWAGPRMDEKAACWVFFNGRNHYDLVNEQWLYKTFQEQGVQPVAAVKADAEPGARGHLAEECLEGDEEEEPPKKKAPQVKSRKPRKAEALVAEGLDEEEEPPKKAPKVKSRKSRKAEAIVAEGLDEEEEPPKKAPKVKSRKPRKAEALVAEGLDEEEEPPKVRKVKSRKSRKAEAIVAESLGKKESPKKVPKLNPRKSIKADGVVADGEGAEVHEPRYVDPRTLLAGNLTSRRYRSEGRHLQEERDWFVSGAYDGPIPLRDASLSDAMAGTYFDRFLGLVRFVDDYHEGETTSTVWEYLDLENVAPWLNHYVENPRFVKKVGGYVPYTTAYLNSLIRAVRAVGKVFVGDPQNDWEAHEWFEGIRRLAEKVTADMRRRPKVRQDILLAEEEEEGEDGDGALLFLPKEEKDLDFLLAKLRVFEEAMRKKEKDVSELGKRSDKVAGKQRYELARMKQAHLASCLLLWHNGRLSDIKDAVLNWDVRKLRTGGGIVWVMDPVEFKTKWRTLEADLREDLGKFLHEKLGKALTEYLKRHRPVLMKSLGPRAKHNVTFTDELHGEGASSCLTLFPGYWPKEQSRTFVQHTFNKVLGCSERVVRKAVSKAITRPLLQEYGVDDVALWQNLHHSREVHERDYARGQRNKLNVLQGKLFRWD
ncbi:unnamed protein product, partial [Effrenium voratum]